MTPLDLAIYIVGNQSALTERVNGRRTTGYVRHWRTNGLKPADAVAIEDAVAAAIADDPAAAARAVEVGGPVRVEQLLPDYPWHRQQDGRLFMEVVSSAKNLAGKEVCTAAPERKVIAP